MRNQKSITINTLAMRPILEKDQN